MKFNRTTPSQTVLRAVHRVRADGQDEAGRVTPSTSHPGVKHGDPKLSSQHTRGPREDGDPKLSSHHTRGLGRWSVWNSPPHTNSVISDRHCLEYDRGSKRLKCKPSGTFRV